jgi:nitroreductase
MTTQRAVRRVKPEPVDDDVLKKILGLAIKAPTGSNAQNWEWIVVRDPKVKAKLAKQYRSAWSLYGRAGRRVKRDEPKMLRVIDAVQWQVDNFEDIPVLIIACLREGWIPKFPWIYRSSRYGSIYPAVQNLLLAARAEGLGAALTTLPLWNRVAAYRILGLPRSVEPIAVIPLGWPIGRYGPTTRRPVEEVTSIDRFGNRAWKPGT